MKSVIGNKAAEWLQIFRFELAYLTAHNRHVQLFGGHSDERFGRPKNVVYENLADHDAQLAKWS